MNLNTVSLRALVDKANKEREREREREREKFIHPFIHLPPSFHSITWFIRQSSVNPIIIIKKYGK